MRKQIEDDESNFDDQWRGVISSVDLIYEVVAAFIDIVEKSGDLMYSPRCKAILTLFLQSFIEFIYGPNIDNQLYLGTWKRFMSVLNKLISV